MGGGDLNSKKSWHPNTIKNQERVWKAEQAAAEEKKRIIELQRERGEERDRAELNELAKRNCGSSSASDNRLHWMYEKPDKKELQEDYLLGKAIGKTEPLDKTEKNIIPAIARRVVGSSMLTSSEDTQVDLARKVREDPLLLVKERERAARAALLNNPLQRRKLTELLRKEQEQKKECKKKTKSKDKDLDDILAAKLNALGGEKCIDLSALLASEDSSSDSSPERPKHKLKKKKKKHSKEKTKSKKSKKKKSDKDRSSENDMTEKIESKNRDRKYESPSRQKGYDSKEQFKSKRERERSVSVEDSHSRVDSIKGDKRSQYDHKSRYLETKRSRRDSFDEKQRSRKPSSKETSTMRESEDRPERSKQARPSSSERAARLAAMMAAGAEREQDRGRRVARQRAADHADAASANRSRPGALLHNEARVLPESLESRIHSNRHYIQRDRRHMNEHFARR